MLVCGAWVRRGAAKESPDKITLEENELKKMIEETKGEIENIDGTSLPNLEENTDLEEEIQTDENIESANKGPANEDDSIIDEYGLDKYDEEEEGTLMTGAGMAGLMYFDSNDDDPYINAKDLQEEEREDLLIKPDDNLFVVGKIEEEYSSLDVYLYNETEDSLYVHHDILLDTFPLCVEWLNYDPCEENNVGNFVALGTMEPQIQIWDLDIIDTIEPVTVLGQKAKKKKKKKQEAPKVGHQDSVLSLSWNQNMKKILASGSADCTVMLWDLQQGSCVYTMKHHTDKVQSICWHPVEAQSLLTASFDKTAFVVDCRNPDLYKKWGLSGEVEQVLWDEFSPYNFYVSTDDGVVTYFDVRESTPVFVLNAHDKEVTGISLSKRNPGCLTTVSADEMLKVWSIKDNKPECVLSRDMKMGGLHFTKGCPDSGLTFAIGGQKDGLRTLNLLETSHGKEHFHGLKETMVNNGERETKVGDESGDAEQAMEALSTLSIKKTSNEGGNIIKKKKKKKK